jgi:predicted DNA-binding transcriptional regulator YafY
MGDHVGHHTTTIPSIVREERMAEDPLERLLDALDPVKGKTAAALAKDLNGVTVRSVRRYLARLRERSPSPVGYSRAAGGFVLAGPRKRWVSVGTDVPPTLAIAANVLRALVGKSCADRLEPLLGNLLADDRRRTALAEALYVRPASLVEPADASASPEIEPFVLMTTLLDAIAAHRRIRMVYLSAERNVEAAREVEPHALALVDGEWLLAAAAPGESRMKDFALQRIRTLETLGDTFTRRAGFRPARHFEGKFRSIAGGPPTTVTLEFAKSVATYAREFVRHPTRKLSNLPDGGLRLRMRVGLSVELEREVLRWGADCVVVEPPELRRRIRERLAAAVARYAAD